MKPYNVILLVFFTLTAFAQSFENENYNWEPDRQLFPLTSEEAEKPAIINKQFVCYEYVYTDSKKDQLYVFKTVHKIITVNSDNAVNQYNKVYIPLENVIDIVNLKARTLSKDGKSRVLDKNQIKEIENDDTEGGNYKLFALEGVEVGGEIEYFYTLKRNFKYSGREFIQNATPQKNVKFQIISPDNLKFECKGYNGLPNISDTTYAEKNYYEVDIPELEPLKEEVYALYNSNLMRVEYQLAFNTDKGNTRLNSLSDAAQYIHQSVHQFSSKDIKAADNLLKTIDIKKYKTEKEKIQAIEQYLKTAVSVYTNVPLTDFNEILNNKYASVLGIVKVYAALFKKLAISYQIVITSDRSSIRFDPDFDGYQYLDNYLFYFPDLEEFLTPQLVNYRFGMMPPYWAANAGLFIKNIKLGDIETGLGKVEFITPLSCDRNLDNLMMNFEFTENTDEQVIQIERKISGYNAIMIQPVYPYLNEDQKEEVKKELIKNLINDAEFLHLAVKNVETDVNPIDEPFIISAKISSSSLLEKAGDKILFKIGESIGLQVELYQEEERQLDVENDYNRKYVRHLQFNIPENYTIKNLDDLKMDIYFEKSGERIFNFTSDYKVEDNTVTINIDEYYTELTCPKEDYEQFRKVINAAADFNKVVLVMEPM